MDEDLNLAPQHIHKSQAFSCMFVPIQGEETNGDLMISHFPGSVSELVSRKKVWKMIKEDS